MTDMGVVALIWRRRAGPIEACRSDTSDTTPADRYSNRVGGVGGERATNDPDLPELKEARADQMVDTCGQRHRTVIEDAEVSDGLDRPDVSVGYPDFVSRTVVETTTWSEPD